MKNNCNYDANINGEDKDKCDTSSICEINKQNSLFVSIMLQPQGYYKQQDNQCRQNTETTMMILE